MRLPDPIANTTTEAYLAYKAGVLNIGDLKPSLYDPYLHYDAWLAYWAGLVDTYPIHDVGKNLFDKDNYEYINNYYLNNYGVLTEQDKFKTIIVRCDSNTTYTVSWDSVNPSNQNRCRIGCFSSKPSPDNVNGTILRTTTNGVYSSPQTITTASDAKWLAIDIRGGNATSSLQDTAESLQIEKGSTATSYEPYTGTPEILTDEEALVAYLSGVTNTYPEEYKDPIDARITGYLRYLVSARFGCPDYPVNNIEFYLSLMKPPIVTNDTPSSNIELDNTAWAELIDVKMYGDTFQQTYTGKNLFKGVAYGEAHQGITTTLVGTSTIHITGKSTASYADLLNWFSPTTALPAGTYTFSINAVQGHTMTMRTSYSEGYDDRVITASGTYITFTTEKDITGMRVFMGTGGTGIDFDKTISLQLEAGNQATTFEPYVGGVPAPNPDYPQPVQTVTGRQTVKVHGKNLFNPIDQDYFVNNAATQAGKSGGYDTGAAIELEPNTTYVVTSKTTQARFRVILMDTLPTSSTGIWGFSGINRDGTSFTSLSFNSGSHKYMIVNATILADIQVEKGSTATTFEPYQSQEYEVNLGKNLFDKNTATILVGQINSNKTYNTTAGKTIFIRCEPNTTYSLQKIASRRSRVGSSASYVPTSGTLTQYAVMSYVSGGYIATLTTGPQDSYIWMTFMEGAGVEPTQQEILDSIQIEKGSQVTSYAPYFTPIELCKISDYQDRIYRNEGTWYLRKEIGKATLDASEDENWVRSGNTTTTSFVAALSRFLDFLAIPNNEEIRKLSKSDYFTYEKNIKYTIGKFAIYNVLEGLSRDLALSFDINAVADITAAKNWIAAHPVTIYGIIAAPTDTPITNAALVAQLDALAAAKSYNEKTYITVEATDPNLPALLKVEAGEYR